MARVTLPAETAMLLTSLTLRTDSLRVRSVAEVCTGAFWRERFGDRGARRIEEDSVHHIVQLRTAIEFDDPSVLSQYAVWVQGVLTNRGMCSRHLAQHFDAIARAVREESLPGARTVETYLGAAVDALRYSTDPARAVYDASESLAASTRAALQPLAGTMPDPNRVDSDLLYLLSYLADAVALNKPDVFVGYVVWIEGYFARRNRPDRYLTAMLTALGHSLDQLTGTVPDACRPLLASAQTSLDVPSQPKLGTLSWNPATSLDNQEFR